ncbi:MAG: hypothetical protein ACFFCW_42050, partial [Candidatus Hodarchaeota archaeon]
MSNRKERENKDLADEIGRPSGFDLPEEEAFFNLMRTSTKILGEFDILFEKYNTTGAQYESLKIIREFGKMG